MTVIGWKTWKPPQHPDDAKLRAAMETLRKMAPAEVFAISVRAGIHNPDGTLTERYRDPLPPTKLAKKKPTPKKKTRAA